MDLKNKKVVVIGFGETGQAVTKLLLKKGAEVIVSENKNREAFSPELIKFFESQGVWFELGGHKKDTLLSGDLIIVSPGVPKEVYKDCLKKGIPVWSELELAWRFLGEKNKKEVVAITGTNGKTTTTAMVSELLKLSGYKVFTGGNYGIPLSELVISNVSVDKIVLEISSFQLENTFTFSPQIGVLLNITPDHLERYASEEEYAYYKYSLFKNQNKNAYSILPFKEKWLYKFSSLIKGNILYFGEKENKEVNAFLKTENEFVLRLKEEEIYSFWGFKLLGIHNKINYMVASLSARLLGAKEESIKKLVKEFTGFPHRLEYIGNFGGVYFINDSKATNVDATLHALKSLPTSIILIMGGRDKGGTYTDLIPYIKEKVKTLILMGEAKFNILEGVGGITETYLVNNLNEATKLAMKVAKPGDIVLLSPGCASFDQFNDYKERGEYFRKLVNKYAPSYFKEKSREVIH